MSEEEEEAQGGSLGWCLCFCSLNGSVDVLNAKVDVVHRSEGMNDPV